VRRVRASSKIVLALFLVAVLTVAFNMRPIEASLGADARALADVASRAKSSSRVSAYESGTWNFDEVDKWPDCAIVDAESAELIVGVNRGEPASYAGIMGLIDENGGRLVDTVSMGGEVRAFVVDVPLGAVSSFVADIRARGLSRYVEPNMRSQISEVPNDPSWGQQWGLAKIEADYAWNTTVGDPSVVVAVIDTGVEWDHPDLAANIWNNTGEVVDGLDNDGNGFVDDVRGWDFVDTTASVAYGEDGTVRDNNPMDFQGHGTHCAGIVAAVTNNSIGIAGVCWNCKIMAVRAGYEGTDGNGHLENDDAAQAIIYAVDNGANVISMSWGSYSSSNLIYEAVRYAYDSGVVLVAAAGNSATSDEHYPAAYDEVIAVTATDADDDPWWSDATHGTNFGDWVELAAPGVDIYSTVIGDSYANKTGTSMAAPHVAGVAALVLSAGARPDMVRQILRDTADDLGDSGFDNYYGYGRVNARKAVEFPDHDLFVTLDTPYCVETGGSSLLDATVQNFGLNDEADVVLQLLVNDTVVYSTTIPELLSGESYAINYLWTPSTDAWYNVTAYAPPVTGEINTENNAESGSILVDALNILIVNDDDGDFRVSGTSLPEFESALTDAGYDYMVWNESSMGNPPLNVLVQFKLVIWTCGDCEWAVDLIDEATLKAYVAQDGNLLLEGEDIGYTQDQLDSGNDFMTNVAHAIYEEDNTHPDDGLTVTDPYHPVTQGLSSSLDWSVTPPYADGVSPTNGGAEVIQYAGTSWSAVTVFDGVGSGSVVYYAFPLYCLNPSEAQVLTINSVDWLLEVRVLPDIFIVNDDDGGKLVSGTSLPEFESALTDAGYDYMVWNESSMGNPPLNVLVQFKLVIWTCGDYWNLAVDTTDAATLEYYIAQGGNLLLEGEDIALNHGDDDFMVNVAHALNETDITGAVGLTVTNPSHPVTYGLPSSFTWLTTPPYDDGVSPTNGGAEVIQYTGTSWSAVTVFDGAGGGSVVYYAFPLYCLSGPEGVNLTVNSVRWLLGLSPVYLVVRGSNNGIYCRTYDPVSGSWDSWVGLPGSSPDSPAAVVVGNELHLVVRGMNGGQIWHCYKNLNDNVFSPWELLDGSTPSAPALTANSTHVCLVVRGNNNVIYYRFYDIATRVWGDWVGVPNGSTLSTPAVALVDGALQVVVRGSNNNQIWHGTMNLETKSFSGWTLLSGATPSPPTLTANSTSLCLVVRGNNNVIYYRFYDLISETWTNWQPFPYGSTPDVPAATIMGDSLQIVVRGMNGNQIWHGTLGLSSGDWSGWTLLDGSTPSRPVLAS
jgi:subtilisin family serine protease